MLQSADYLFINIDPITKFDKTIPWALNNKLGKCEADKINCPGDTCPTDRQMEIPGASR